MTTTINAPNKAYSIDVTASSEATRVGKVWNRIVKPIGINLELVLGGVAHQEQVQFPR